LDGEAEGKEQEAKDKNHEYLNKGMGVWKWGVWEYKK
jgi:hypothetical protein